MKIYDQNGWNEVGMVCEFCAWALRAEEAITIIMIGGKRYPCCAYHYILYGGLSDENL